MVRSMIKQVAAASLVVAAAVGLTVATSGTALAWGPACRNGEVSTGFKFTGDGIKIRTRPVGNATVLGLGYRSHSLAGGARSGDFIYIIDWTTNVRGWAPGAYVTWQCAGQTHPAG
ncbi:hypothetical protein UK23_46700 [Lentzea aerocolonigenes]|uniref:SH3b domain-containing protein n=2 Tax=Lentzea aerocolonigenes TaxID=68170 RepID=A0A0F0GGQ9_LENAE|nr:hypothetical protein UK23_46700 [Lentzea aerocolonigenes]